MLRILGGRHKMRRLFAPKVDFRPSMGGVKEALFSILGDVEGVRFCDLFAGSGAVGLEALSRGAKETLFVEQDRKSASVIKKNLDILKEEAEVIPSDVTSFLGHFEGAPFDVVFADPPYGKGWPCKILALLDQSPLLKSGGLCFIEEGIQLKLPALQSFTFVKERRYGSTYLYEWKKR